MVTKQFCDKCNKELILYATVSVSVRVEYADENDRLTRVWFDYCLTCAKAMYPSIKFKEASE